MFVSRHDSCIYYLIDTNKHVRAIRRDMYKSKHVFVQSLNYQFMREIICVHVKTKESDAEIKTETETKTETKTDDTDVIRHEKKSYIQTPIQVVHKNCELCLSCLISPQGYSRVEINMKYRAILFDWLVEVAQKFKYSLCTLHQCFFLFNRVASRKLIIKDKIQLYGITCLWIAAKNVEYQHINVRDCSAITANAYSCAQIVETELIILKCVKFILNSYSAYDFLESFSRIYLPDVNVYTEDSKYMWINRIRLLSMYLINYFQISFPKVKYTQSAFASAILYISVYTCTECHERKNRRLEYFSILWDREFWFTRFVFVTLVPVIKQLLEHISMSSLNIDLEGLNKTFVKVPPSRWIKQVLLRTHITKHERKTLQEDISYLKHFHCYWMFE